MAKKAMSLKMTKEDEILIKLIRDIGVAQAVYLKPNEVDTLIKKALVSYEKLNQLIELFNE